MGNITLDGAGDAIRTTLKTPAMKPRLPYQPSDYDRHLEASARGSNKAPPKSNSAFMQGKQGIPLLPYTDPNAGSANAEASSGPYNPHDMRHAPKGTATYCHPKIYSAMEYICKSLSAHSHPYRDPSDGRISWTQARDAVQRHITQGKAWTDNREWSFVLEWRTSDWVKCLRSTCVHAKLQLLLAFNENINDLSLIHI